MSDPKALQAIWPDIPQSLMPYSPAVKAADRVFVSGQLATDSTTGVAPEVLPDNPNLQSGQALNLDVPNEYIEESRPASAAVSIRALPVRNTHLEIDMVAICDGSEAQGAPAPEGAPMPLAGYSPAIRGGDWIFLSNEVPTDRVGDYDIVRNLGLPSALVLN